MNTAQSRQDAFTIERHGDVTVIAVSAAVELMDSTLIDEAAELILAPLRSQECPLVVVDLTEVPYFGSIFLGLLLRCWKLASVKGGLMALVGVSERAKELLRVTSLDMVWPIYATRREAVEALEAD